MDDRNGEYSEYSELRDVSFIAAHRAILTVWLPSR